MIKLTKEQIYGDNRMSREEKINMFEQLLQSTNRPGVDKVIKFLQDTDFYKAPASAKYHSNYDGGLMDHSMMVYSVACSFADILGEIDPEIKSQLKEDSIILSCLLHDVCKCCMYVPAKKWKKDDDNMWVQYDGYDIQDSFPIGHGEKSVIMLNRIGLELDACEMLAIRYHMGLWGETNKEFVSQQKSAIDICKLVLLVQMADHTASQMFEPTIE